MKQHMCSSRVFLILAMLLGSVSQLGCASSKSAGPYASPPADGRNPHRAQALTLEAAELGDRDPERAQQLLHEALSADIYHGPAHNNLGVLHLKHGRIYEAANEFEWARKLMPGHPDPRMNLALTLERAGRIDDALATYDSALEVYPNHVPTMQALVRLQMRRNRTDHRTPGMLEEIALAGESLQWREWAQAQMLRGERSSLNR